MEISSNTALALSTLVAAPAMAADNNVEMCRDKAANVARSTGKKLPDGTIESDSYERILFATFQDCIKAHPASTYLPPWRQ